MRTDEVDSRRNIGHHLPDDEPSSFLSGPDMRCRAPSLQPQGDSKETIPIVTTDNHDSSIPHRSVRMSTLCDISPTTTHQAFGGRHGHGQETNKQQLGLPHTRNSHDTRDNLLPAYQARAKHQAAVQSRAEAEAEAGRLQSCIDQYEYDRYQHQGQESVWAQVWIPIIKLNPPDTDEMPLRTHGGARALVHLLKDVADLLQADDNHRKQSVTAAAVELSPPPPLSLESGYRYNIPGTTDRRRHVEPVVKSPYTTSKTADDTRQRYKIDIHMLQSDGSLRQSSYLSPSPSTWEPYPSSSTSSSRESAFSGHEDTSAPESPSLPIPETTTPAHAPTPGTLISLPAPPCLSEAIMSADSPSLITPLRQATSSGLSGDLCLRSATHATAKLMNHTATTTSVTAAAGRGQGHRYGYYDYGGCNTGSGNSSGSGSGEGRDRGSEHVLLSKEDLREFQEGFGRQLAERHLAGAGARSCGLH